jgi:hypothetical protein
MTSLLGLLLLATSVLASDSIPKKTLIIANITGGRNVVGKDAKMEAGLALAVELTNKYSLISGHVVDSVASIFIAGSADKNRLPGVNQVAAKLNAHGILFVRIDRLENILRAEIQIAHGQDYSTIVKGVGYSIILYRS